MALIAKTEAAVKVGDQEITLGPRGLALKLQERPVKSTPGPNRRVRETGRPAPWPLQKRLRVETGRAYHAVPPVALGGLHVVPAACWRRCG